MTILHRIPSRAALPARQRGVTLVELMVALVLGLVVSGAALALFLTNRQTYVASENLDRIQEASRTAFELMSRDLREAGGNPCSNELTIKNQLGATTAWWSKWGNGTATGLIGYAAAEPFPDDGFGTAARKRVDGTAAIDSWSAVPTGQVVNVKQTGTAVPLDVTTAPANAAVTIATNDIVMACDYDQATVFQATSVTANKIAHAASGTPGNTVGNFDVVYDVNTMIAKLRPTRWYVGYNGRTDQYGNALTSLYRATLVQGATAAPTPAEIVPNVTDMDIEYLLPGSAAYTKTPASFDNVVAIKVQLTYVGRDRIDSESNKLDRTFTNVVALRSRAL